MKLSVIIPTCNRNNLLRKCLDLLAPANQTIVDDYEVIITDDSSENIAKDLAHMHYKWAKWVEGPKRGPAANRNNGAKTATGDWVVFIDDDCLPYRNLLEEYKKGKEENGSSLAFEGAILPDNWELLKRDMSECPVNTEGNCFWSANICVQKQLFNNVGGFDESFILAAQEDQDLFNKLKKHTSVTFLKKCVVVHPVRFTTLLKQILKIPAASKNFALFAVKNKEHSKLSSMGRFAFDQFRFHLIWFFKHLRHGRFKSSFTSVAWLFYGVPLNIINVVKLLK
jgi:glycosyltransferase involved in cell wall biosynthesis